MQLNLDNSQKLADQQFKRKVTISLTPLIDVVFILLIFFMLASSLLDWRSFDLDVSAETPPIETDDEPIVVSIKQDELLLNNVIITREALLIALRQRKPGTVVSVQPLAQTNTQRLINVLDLLNTAGIEPLSLLDDPNWISTNPMESPIALP
ncbi:MAG: ExbD/TolR family protein [Gammaproteobacteria bacterium]